MIKCPVCGKELLNNAGLGGHMVALHPPVDSAAIVSMFKTVTSVIKTYGDEIQEMHRWQMSQADKLLQLLDMIGKAKVESRDRDSQLHETVAGVQECVTDFIKMITPWVEMISERTKPVTVIPVVKVKHAKD